MTSIPLTVTAFLSTPVIGVDRAPIMLDAPLSYAYVQRAARDGQQLPAITDQFAADFPLPLDRWHEYGTWGWCTSRGLFGGMTHVAAQVRRKPAVDAMARYTPDRTHHAGLGPTKARDATLSAVLTDTMTWHVLATDRADLEDLLGLVDNIGARHRNNFGHVSRWLVEPGRDRDAWCDRPWPPAFAARAPYWHPTRRVQC